VRRGEAIRFWLVIGVLLLLQFAVRSRLGDDRVAPDFLLLALLLYTIRSRPGPSAAAGFLVGLIGDALTPASFGAGALAHTIVGYLSSWAKAVFFAENLLVNGGLFFAGTWLRNVILVVASGKFSGQQLTWEVFVWSPLEGLTTAAAGIVILIVFRQWLPIRLSES
jgi:rod shape-determining protein MreD